MGFISDLNHDWIGLYNKNPIQICHKSEVLWIIVENEPNFYQKYLTILWFNWKDLKKIELSWFNWKLIKIDQKINIFDLFLIQIDKVLIFFKIKIDLKYVRYDQNQKDHNWSILIEINIDFRFCHRNPNSMIIAIWF